jgi:hypothetical protein
VTDEVGDLPFVDEHRTRIPAPREVVWSRLLPYVDASLATMKDSVFSRVLGTRPPGGFEVSAEDPERRLVLTGRHRFSQYALLFELTDLEGEATLLRARTYARFPGPHGRVYRLLVIGSRLHVVATRGMLAAIRRACLEPGAR